MPFIELVIAVDHNAEQVTFPLVAMRPLHAASASDTSFNKSSSSTPAKIVQQVGWADRVGSLGGQLGWAMYGSLRRRKMSGRHTSQEGPYL